MPLTVWKGFLKLSLVTCPVRLQPATTRANRIVFHTLNRATRNRIEMRPHDAASGAEIGRDALVRGYEAESGRFVLIEDAELAAIETEASRTIELTTFIDRGEIDPLYYATPYVIAPDGPAADETFRVVHAAMAHRNRAGLGRVVLSNREHLALVAPRGAGMALTTLRSAAEVKAAEPFFADVPAASPSEEMMALATRLIEERMGRFDPGRLEDRYQAALARLVEAKLAGNEPSALQQRPVESAEIIDLMAALKRSLREGPAVSPGGRGKSARRRRKSTAHRPDPGR